MTKVLAIVAAVSIGLLIVTGMLLRHAWADLGKAELALEQANVVIKEKEKAAHDSEIAVIRLQAKMEATENIAQPYREKIIYATSTINCIKSPAIIAAVGGVRELLTQRANRAEAGRVTPTPLFPAQASPTR